MAFDNSNNVGVTGAGPYETPTTGNPQDVTTGIEFSIPLSQLGKPAGQAQSGSRSLRQRRSRLHLQPVFRPGLLLGNVGGSPFPNLALDYPGDQFVSVANPGAAAAAPCRSRVR